MSKIATIPVFSSIVAILFFLNCQRWDYRLKTLIKQYFLLYSYIYKAKNRGNLQVPPDFYLSCAPNLLSSAFNILS